MWVPCKCGYAVHYCPCCGRRLETSEAVSKAFVSMPKRPSIAEGATAVVSAQPAPPPTTTPETSTSEAPPPPPPRAAATWRALLPTKSLTAFDLFVAVVSDTTPQTDNADANDADPVLRLLSDWKSAHLSTPNAAEPPANGEAKRSHLARAWLTAPHELRSGCEAVAAWWTHQVAPPLLVKPPATPCHANAAAPSSAPLAPVPRTREYPSALHNVRAHAATSANASEKRAAHKGTKRFPSSFDLFRKAVKRKSLTTKAVCELWATMSDADKAPYDVQAATIRTTALLGTQPSE